MFAHRIASFTLLGGIACGPQLPPAGPEPQTLDLGASLLLSIGGISPGDEAPAERLGEVLGRRRHA